MHLKNNFLRNVLCVTVLATALGVFADAKNVLISFSSGPVDRYADGATVLDGEWYALVWSPAGQTFGGLNLDATPTKAGDEVVYLAPLAKGGKCPFTVFQIDSQDPKAHADGTYAVYMLDTRNAAKTAPAKADAASGKPEAVNAAVAAQKFEAAVSEVAKSGTAASGDWAASAVDTSAEGYTAPRISAFKVNGAKVEITVTGMMPGIQYNVHMGPAPDTFDTYGLATPKTCDANGVSFTLDAADAKFFKVTRQPLK